VYFDCSTHFPSIRCFSLLSKVNFVSRLAIPGIKRWLLVFGKWNYRISGVKSSGMLLFSSRYGVSPQAALFSSLRFTDL